MVFVAIVGFAGVAAHTQGESTVFGVGQRQIAEFGRFVADTEFEFERQRTVYKLQCRQKGLKVGRIDAAAGRCADLERCLRQCTRYVGISVVVQAHGREGEHAAGQFYRKVAHNKSLVADRCFRPHARQLETASFAQRQVLEFDVVAVGADAGDIGVEVDVVQRADGLDFDAGGLLRAAVRRVRCRPEMRCAVLRC